MCKMSQQCVYTTRLYSSVFFLLVQYSLLMIRELHNFWPYTIFTYALGNPPNSCMISHQPSLPASAPLSFYLQWNNHFVICRQYKTDTAIAVAAAVGVKLVQINSFDAPLELIGEWHRKHAPPLYKQSLTPPG